MSQTISSLLVICFKVKSKKRHANFKNHNENLNVTNELKNVSSQDSISLNPLQR